MSPEFYAKHPNPYIRLFTDLAKGKNTFSVPRVGIWRQYNDEMRAAFDAVWIGTQTPEQALATARRRIQPKLDREIARQRRRQAQQAQSLRSTTRFARDTEDTERCTEIRRARVVDWRGVVGWVACGNHGEHGGFH